MLAARPSSAIDPHDTDVDDREDRPTVRVRLRSVRPDRRESSANSRALRSGPVLAGAPVTHDDAMRPAALSRVRVREALVKVQHSIAAEARERRAPTPAPIPSKFAVPEVRVAWTRSTDHAQKIVRAGADAFFVDGTADGGPTAVNATVQKPRVALGIDGLIFGVAVEKGATAGQTFDRLVEKLNAFYEVEIVERREDYAAARLVSAR